MAPGHIQIQVNLNGNWRTVKHVANQSQHITHGMNAAQKTFPEKRVRAVDGSGRLVDML
jgi:hypothetical protein